MISPPLPCPAPPPPPLYFVVVSHLENKDSSVPAELARGPAPTGPTCLAGSYGKYLRSSCKNYGDPYAPTRACWRSSAYAAYLARKNVCRRALLRAIHAGEKNERSCLCRIRYPRSCCCCCRHFCCRRCCTTYEARRSFMAIQTLAS